MADQEMPPLMPAQNGTSTHIDDDDHTDFPMKTAFRQQARFYWTPPARGAASRADAPQ